MEPVQQAKPNFMQSAAISGLIFGLITTIFSLISAYRVMATEPTGSIFPPGSFSNIVVCLVAAFGGMLAVKIQSSEEKVMLMGRGAAIGAATGVAIALVATILGQLWTFIDPNYVENFVEAMRIHMGSIPNMPDDALEQSVDGIYEGMTTFTGILKNLGISGAVFAALNAITGMIGARVFCEKPDII